MDFCWLKTILNNIIAEITGKAMEENDYFRQNSSSAENVAKYIYEKLRAKLPENVELECITVTETPGCSAKFGK